MKFVKRSEWGARRPRHRVTASLSSISTAHWNGPKVLVGGKTTWDHSKCAGLVRGIQNFHMDGKGWSDIAYNFLECPHGYTFEGRGLNVVNGANGTNTGNRTSHAICSLAGQGNPFLESEKVGFRACVKYIADNTAAPDKCIGHRDHKSTECPGNERYNWVHQNMPVSSTPTPTPNPGTRKELSMEAALLLIKIHYDNKRGNGTGTYDVAVRDRVGWGHWLNELLAAQDAGRPLREITDACNYLVQLHG